MSALAGHVADYLRLRRGLGFKLAHPGQVLPQFAAWCDAHGVTTVTVQAAMTWTRLSKAGPISLSHRLGAVRGFARYLHTIDPATQIPPAGVFGTQQRAAPHIYSAEQISALVDAAGRLQPALRAVTYQTLLRLLAATGMRVGEALHLKHQDVDLSAGLITIRHAKFDRDRLVPMHPSVTEVLSQYATGGERASASATAETFFVSTDGSALSSKTVGATFATLRSWTGLSRPTGAQCRLMDLRHSFVVHTLIDWQRQGLDVAAWLPVLSTYLGHVSPASTYWYISAVPELMHLAATSLQALHGGQQGAGS